MALTCGLLLAVGGGASANTICDLTVNSTCPSIGGGLFYTDEQHPTGTGYVDSFARIEQNGWEQGYNTSARPLQSSVQMKVDPNYTRDLTLGEVGIKSIGGVNYREFFLDVNEPAATNNQQNWITLDQLEVFVSNTASLNNYSATGPNNASGSLQGATKIYDLDTATSDNYIQIDYLKNGNGSGSSDLVFYLKDSLFKGYSYVYLFSELGDLTLKSNNDKYESQAGFEEWFTKSSIPPPVTAVPEPATLALLGTGLAMVVRRRRRRA